MENIQKKNQIEEVSKNIAPTHPELTKLYTPFSPIVIRSFACLFWQRLSYHFVFVSLVNNPEKKKLNEQPAAAEVNNNNKKIVSAETH